MKSIKAFRPAIFIMLTVIMLVAAMQGGWLTATAVPEPGDIVFAEEFMHPDGSAKPYIRWWISPSSMNETGTKAEVRKMAEAGFGGLELVCIAGGTFGNAAWNNTMKWALEEAIECGIQLDFTIGQGWPIKTPAVPANDVRSEQGLFRK